MKTLKYFTMAALALMAVACSNDDNELISEQPAQAKGITITVQLPPKDGGITRAVTQGTNKIESTWAENEHLAIRYDIGTEHKVADAEITHVATDGSATMTFTLEDGVDMESPLGFELIYPYSAFKDVNSGMKDFAEMLAVQDGTLNAALDVRLGNGNLNISLGTIAWAQEPTAQFAICKFTLKVGSELMADELVIRDNENNNIITTVKPTAPTSELYVALPPMSSKAIKFTAFSGALLNQVNKYNKTATATLNEGKYYPTEVNFPEGTLYPIALANATVDELGFLVANDGKVYYNAASITAASKTAIGVVAYLGNDEFSEKETNMGTTEAPNYVGGHGLVLSLKNAASNVEWSTEDTALKFGGQQVNSEEDLKRTTNVSGLSNTVYLLTFGENKYPAAQAAWYYTPVAPDGTTGWFLPSAQQWVMIQEALGGLDADEIKWQSWFDNNHTAIDKWEAALAKAGSGNYESMTATKHSYWTSSEFSSTCAVTLSINATNTGAEYGFGWGFGEKNWKNSNHFVRPVFAF